MLSGSQREIKLACCSNLSWLQVAINKILILFDSSPVKELIKVTYDVKQRNQKSQLRDHLNNNQTSTWANKTKEKITQALTLRLSCSFLLLFSHLKFNNTWLITLYLANKWAQMRSSFMRCTPSENNKYVMMMMMKYVMRKACNTHNIQQRYVFIFPSTWF